MASIAFRGSSCLRIALALVVSACASSASAQIVRVAPALYAKPALAIFGSPTANITPNFPSYGTPLVLGYTLGGYLQTTHIIGLELRGTIQRDLNAEHQESAVGGVRFGLPHGRFSPYVSALGGYGNGWRFRVAPVEGIKPPKPIEGNGPQWTIVGGADYHLTHHFAVRLGEISYSTLYLKNWNLTPLNVSAGFVYRIN